MRFRCKKLRVRHIAVVLGVLLLLFAPTRYGLAADESREDAERQLSAAVEEQLNGIKYADLDALL
ncbi:MAG: hypothetical protein LBM78_04785, partial [Clostridiales bacterium]|nr:hypothetical protein [Clostridiales bacterium]